MQGTERGAPGDRPVARERVVESVLAGIQCSSILDLANTRERRNIEAGGSPFYGIRPRVRRADRGPVFVLVQNYRREPGTMRVLEVEPAALGDVVDRIQIVEQRRRSDLGADVLNQLLLHLAENHGGGLQHWVVVLGALPLLLLQVCLLLAPAPVLLFTLGALFVASAAIVFAVLRAAVVEAPPVR